MFSEVIVLSSDDEDENLLAVQHKRIKVQHVDADLAVIEKMPTVSDAKWLERNVIGCLKGPQAKPLQDDDCCILSCNPESDVHVPDFQANDGDDLVIVRESGPVACRDFPHARHLCVKFPYATTPHEKHCEQCHCYVCDVFAPCIHWGQGRHCNDHCHAFDKDDRWKKLRSQTRSRLTKLVSRPQISAQREKVVQPQPRTFTQVPSRSIFMAGQNGCPAPSNLKAYLSSFNHDTPNLSGMHANWHPSVSLNQNSMLGNVSQGNQVATQETNSQYRRNSFNPTEHGAIGFVEYRSPIVNVTTPSSTSPGPQSDCQPKRSAFFHAQHTNVQTAIYRPFPIPPTNSIAALQPEADLQIFTGSQTQHHQGEKPVLISEIPYNHTQLPDGTERISARSSAPPVTNFTRDLMTLQNYLLEGISKEPLYQSPMASESNVTDTEHRSFLGDSAVQRPLQTVHYVPGEPVSNPPGPGAILPSDNAVARLYSAHSPNFCASKVDMDNCNIPSDGARNKTNTEYPLDDGCEMNNASLLDHILTGLDQEFWSLLEPAVYPGF